MMVGVTFCRNGKYHIDIAISIPAILCANLSQELYYAFDNEYKKDLESEGYGVGDIDSTEEERMLVQF